MSVVIYIQNFDQTQDLQVLGRIKYREDKQVPETDVKLSVNVPVDNLRSAFKYKSLGDDMDEESAFAQYVQLDERSSKLIVPQSVYEEYNEETNPGARLDFLQQLAREVFGSTGAVDLFSNEDDVKLAYTQAVLKCGKNVNEFNTSSIRLEDDQIYDGEHADAGQFIKTMYSGATSEGTYILIDDGSDGHIERDGEPGDGSNGQEPGEPGEPGVDGSREGKGAQFRVEFASEQDILGNTHNFIKSIEVLKMGSKYVAGEHIEFNGEFDGTVTMILSETSLGYINGDLLVGGHAEVTYGGRITEGSFTVIDEHPNNNGTLDYEKGFAAFDVTFEEDTSVDMPSLTPQYVPLYDNKEFLNKTATVKDADDNAVTKDDAGKFNVKLSLDQLEVTMSENGSGYEKDEKLVIDLGDNMSLSFTLTEDAANYINNAGYGDKMNLEGTDAQVKESFTATVSGGSDVNVTLNMDGTVVVDGTLSGNVEVDLNTGFTMTVASNGTATFTRTGATLDLNSEDLVGNTGSGAQTDFDLAQDDFFFMANAKLTTRGTYYSNGKMFMKLDNNNGNGPDAYAQFDVTETGTGATANNSINKVGKVSSVLVRTKGKDYSADDVIVFDESRFRKALAEHQANAGEEPGAIVDAALLDQSFDMETGKKVTITLKSSALKMMNLTGSGSEQGAHGAQDVLSGLLSQQKQRFELEDIASYEGTTTSGTYLNIQSECTSTDVTTHATFDITFNTSDNKIARVLLNTPGAGYKKGDAITLKGSFNGEVALTLSGTFVNVLNGENAFDEMPIKSGDKLQMIFTIMSHPDQKDASNDLVHVTRTALIEINAVNSEGTALTATK